MEDSAKPATTGEKKAGASDFRKRPNPGKSVLFVGFALLAGLYFLTYINANNDLRTFARHDDALFVQQGMDIAAGHWLGEYTRLTLVKTPGFPLFVALSIKTRIPYLWLTAICHIVAVFFLLRKSAFLFDRTRFLLYLLGGFLLFNPILAGALRIYRFQLPAICFVVFLGTVVHLFNPHRRKRHWYVSIPDFLTAFLAYGFLWFSREESLYFTGCLVTALIGYLLTRPSLAHPLRNLSFVLSGLVGIGVFWLAICSLNNRHYGRFIVCEKTSPPYTEAIGAFLSIADPARPSHVSGSTASREKILKIAEEVPEFRRMSTELLTFSGRWQGTYLDRRTLEFVAKPKGTLTVSHFEWAWMDAASAAGYYKNARTLATFHQGLADGLKKAIEEDRLSTEPDILARVGPYLIRRADLPSIAGLMWKNYPKLFQKPSEIARDFKNLVSRVSVDSTGKEATRKAWEASLGLHYLDQADAQGIKHSVESRSNRWWNHATALFAYTAVPLMHLATPLALIAFLVATIRRRWGLAALIAVLASMAFSHYLMLTILDVAGGYNATHRNYFLPSYGTILLVAFLSIRVLLEAGRKPGDQT